MSVVVRAARTEDYPAIARISVAAFEADGQLTNEPSYIPILADVASRAAVAEILVAVDAVDEVLGAVTFVPPGSTYAHLAGPGEAEFRMLAVDPVAQGRGVGEALARACVRRATDLGCSAVVICANEMAVAAHRLYARLGFVREPKLDWSSAPGVLLLGLRLEL